MPVSTRDGRRDQGVPPAGEPPRHLSNTHLVPFPGRGSTVFIIATKVDQAPRHSCGLLYAHYNLPKASRTPVGYALTHKYHRAQRIPCDRDQRRQTQYENLRHAVPHSGLATIARDLPPLLLSCLARSGLPDSDLWFRIDA